MRVKFVVILSFFILFALLSMSFLVGSSSKSHDPKSHRVMSCNIRVALDSDEENGVGWSSRKDVCIEIIKNYNPDIVCFQEVLRVQNNDLKEAFTDYMILGFDGPEMDRFSEGYHGIAKNPIMFSKKRYELIAAGGYWLSETPLIAGSISWESARARNCNWVRLRDRITGVEFRVIDAHLDHVVQEAKEMQVGVILEEAAQYADSFPQLFAGDFNSKMKNKVITTIKSSGWSDTYSQIHGEIESGRTTHGFKGVDILKENRGGRIDFIFARGPVKATDSKIVYDQIGGIYPSDHFFIYADVEIE